MRESHYIVNRQDSDSSRLNDAFSGRLESYMLTAADYEKKISHKTYFKSQLSIFDSVRWCVL